jgi:hypothetical protein
MDLKKSNKSDNIIQKKFSGLEVKQDTQHQFKKKSVTASADSGNTNISSGHSIDQLKKKYMGNINTSGGPVTDAMNSNPPASSDVKKENYNVVVVEEKNNNNADAADESVKKRTYIIEDDDIKAAQG